MADYSIVFEGVFGTKTFIIQPQWGFDYRTLMSAGKERDKTEITIPLRGFLTGIPPEPFTQFMALADIVEAKEPMNVTFKHGDTILKTFFAADFIGTPVLRNLRTSQRPAEFANYVEFTAEIYILEGAEKLSTTKRESDVQRTITTNIYNQRLTEKIWRVTAKGPDAEKVVRKLRPKNVSPLYENYIREIDNATFVGEWRWQKTQSDASPNVSIIKWEENIVVQASGRPIFWTLITGDEKPIQRRGRKRAAIVRVTGTIRGQQKPFEPKPEKDIVRPPLLLGEEFLDETKSELFNPLYLVNPISGIWERTYIEHYEIPDLTDAILGKIATRPKAADDKLVKIPAKEFKEQGEPSATTQF